MSQHEVLSYADSVLGFFAVCLAARIVYLKVRSSKPLPPGPKRLPLIGNLLDLPKGPEGPHWAKHKALYGELALYAAENIRELTMNEGPISSVEVFGSTMIIVNDRDVAVDLLDKRSAIYSCRPVLTFGGEL